MASWHADATSHKSCNYKGIVHLAQDLGIQVKPSELGCIVNFHARNLKHIMLESYSMTNWPSPKHLYTDLYTEMYGLVLRKRILSMSTGELLGNIIGDFFCNFFIFR